MYYLNDHLPKDNQEKMNPTWTHAGMVLERVENFKGYNEFIRASDEDFKAWFRKKFGIEINKVQRPKSYNTQDPKPECEKI